MADLPGFRDLAPYAESNRIVSQGGSESEERALPLSHYIWVLKWHRWRILAFVAICVSATFLVSRRLTPLYEATTTINVDRQMPRGGMGDSGGSPIVSPLDADQFLATQASLIKSDSVLRTVIDRFHLRGNPAGQVSAERLAELENAPAALGRLEVTRPANTYLLQIRYRSPNPRLSSDVTNAVADAYLEHLFRIRVASAEKLGSYMRSQLEQLKAKMERSSQHLVSFERELNVINPDQKTSIQSASLLQLNSDYNTIREERGRKEAAYNSVRSGSFNAAWTSTQGEALRKLTEGLNDARQKLTQAKLHYGESHPEYVRAQTQVREVESQILETKANIVEQVAIEFHQALDRESMLRAQLAETRAEFDRLNAKSFDYQSLKEEADADKKVYDELVRKIRESGINASFQDSSIRISDRARAPANPVFPRTQLNLFIAFLLSTALAAATVIAADLLDNTVRDPEEASRSLDVTVVGTLPAVNGLKGRINPLLTQGSSELIVRSGYEEAVRTLRNSMLLTDFNSRLRSILVTSASPAEGKSTVAAHLAVAHSEQGHRTLLIDGDLRRPSVHKFFGASNDKGLSSALFGVLSWRDAVIDVLPFKGLRILTAGPMSRRAADLVGRALPQILEEALQDYDFVILDSPPMIGFPEPLQMASSVDGVLVVARAGHTNRKSVASVLGILRRLHSNIVGLVLNEVTPDMSDSYYYHEYYRSYYRIESGSVS